MVKYRCTNCYNEIDASGDPMRNTDIKLGKRDYIELSMCNKCRTIFNGRDIYHDTQKMKGERDGK